MLFGILTLLTGLALSTVAAWFAIEGIMSIFAGLPTYGMIMGIVIEAGKVIGITWIYRNWSSKTLLKWIMIPFVVAMMGLTSGGIYGMLSRAHLEQTAPVSNNTVKIERLDQRIAREKAEIADAEAIIAQLDETIQVLVDAKKISHPTNGARVVRIKQQPQRDQLKKIIDDSLNSIDEYEDAKLELNQQLNDLELEVGPIKYIAAFIFEHPDQEMDKAVRMVIVAFIFVFDPMAIMLLMAGNYTLMSHVKVNPKQPDDDEDDDSEPEPSVTSAESLRPWTGHIETSPPEIRDTRKIEQPPEPVDAVPEPVDAAPEPVDPPPEIVEAPVEQQGQPELKHHRDILDQLKPKQTDAAMPPSILKR